MMELLDFFILYTMVALKKKDIIIHKRFLSFVQPRYKVQFIIKHVIITIRFHILQHLFKYYSICQLHTLTCSLHIPVL